MRINTAKIHHFFLTVGIWHEKHRCVSSSRWIITNHVSLKSNCVVDAPVGRDPTLFPGPCKCIEDARSLVLGIDPSSASKRNFDWLNDWLFGRESSSPRHLLLCLLWPSCAPLRGCLHGLSNKQPLRGIERLRRNFGCSHQTGRWASLIWNNDLASAMWACSQIAERGHFI